MIADAAPWEWFPGGVGKQQVYRLVNSMGIWQGQWRMFTPAPVVNTNWMTADINVPGRELEQWESTYWGDASTFEKFIWFRHMNYSTRVQLARDQRGSDPVPSIVFAADDLAAYLNRCAMENRIPRGFRAAETFGLAPVVENHSNTQVRLVSNGVTLVPDQEGRLLPADEIIWTTYSSTIAEVEQEQ